MTFSTVLLIDNLVQDYQCFVDHVSQSTLPMVYSSSTTRENLLNQLSGFTTIDRIGIVSEKYNLFLEEGKIYSEENTQFLTTLIRTFQVKHIDFLACNTLHHPLWNEFYVRLQNDTGVIVGASDNNTGNIKYGGDWLMESTSEDIELIYFTKSIEYYKYLLMVSDFMLVIKNDGFLWGVGKNNLGQLGCGTNEDENSFQKIITSRTPKFIAMGGSHSIVWMTDGSLWGTGYNYWGQLGLGDRTDMNTFQEITGLSGKVIKSISCGLSSTVVAMMDGTLWGTGRNNEGQLGLGGTSYTTIFQQITLPNGLLADAVFCGPEYTAVVTTTGLLLCSGLNYAGQFGINSIRSQRTFVQCGIDNVKTLGTAEAISIVALQNGSLKAAGILSRLGLNNPNGSFRTTFQPITVNVQEKVAKYVSCGADHTIVMMTDGTLWGTGDNGVGQLGLGDQLMRITFIQITQNISGKTPLYIAGVGSNTYVLMTDGTLWVTGKNNLGQVGLYTNGANIISLTQTLTDVLTIPGYVPGIYLPATITNMSTTTGTTNTLVIITGTSLATTSNVLFGTINATISSVSATSIRVFAPENSGTVSIIVRDTLGNNVVAGSFTYTASSSPFYKSTICFPAGTLVESDQGSIAIQKLIPGFHTFRGKDLLAVPETYSMDSLLVCVEKDALRKNSPHVQTLITPRHKIYYKGKLKAAFRFVDNHKGFSFVPYTGEKLYNVLLEEYSTMNVQGMICETLHPSNPFSKIILD